MVAVRRISGRTRQPGGTDNEHRYRYRDQTRKFAIGRYATVVTRVLTGLLFATTGLNGFLMFMPAPDPSTMAPAGVAFSGALYATGYMLQLASGVQLLSGLLLLVGRFVPLALAMLAPMVVNIFLFHVFLEPSAWSWRCSSSPPRSVWRGPTATSSARCCKPR